MIQPETDRGRAAWKAWWEESRLDRLVVISPHLDDGIFSAFELLTYKFAVTPLLATIFSDAPGDLESSWGLETGFRNNREEFSARRQEDAAAAAALAIQAQCWNQHVRDWNADAAALRCDKLVQALDGSAASTLVLLAAGAGKPLPFLTRNLRRVLRIPRGAPAHPEHLAATTLLRAPLKQRGFKVGYYAEIPYVWADRVEDVHSRLELEMGTKLQRITMQPDTEEKHVAASFYKSQVRFILGKRRRTQLKTLSHPEHYFLPMLK